MTARVRFARHAGAMESAPTPKRVCLWLAAAEVVMAAALILPHLGAKSLWLDEFFTIEFALDPHRYWTLLSGLETNMWLYFALMQGWALLGQGELWLRGFSALCALACVPAVVFVGAQLFSRRAGLLAGLVLPLNPFFLHYARETRSYALMMFLSLCATAMLVRLLQAPSGRRGAAYGAIVLAGVFTHFFSALHALAHAVSLLGLPLRRWPWRPLLIASGVVVAGAAAMFIFLGPRDPDMTSWIVRPSWSQLASACRELAGGGGWTGVLYAAAALAACGFAWVDQDRRWPWSIVAATAIVPVAVAYLYSVLHQPLFQPRYLAPVVPALALCAGAVVDRIRPKAVAGALVLLFACASVAPARAELRAPGWENWRGLTEYVRAASLPSDVLVCHARYLMRAVRLQAQLTEPLPVTLHDLDQDMPAGSTPQSAPPPEAFTRLAREYDRLWLVLGHNNFSHLRSQEQTAKLAEALRAHYVKVEAQPFGVITLELWTRRAAHEDLEPDHRGVQSAH